MLIKLSPNNSKLIKDEECKYRVYNRELIIIVSLLIAILPKLSRYLIKVRSNYNNLTICNRLGLEGSIATIYRKITLRKKNVRVL